MIHHAFGWIGHGGSGLFLAVLIVAVVLALRDRDAKRGP
jgi:hypothetical protein